MSLWKAQTTVGTCAKSCLALFVDVVGVVCCLDSAIQLLLKSINFKDRRNHFVDVLRAKIIQFLNIEDVYLRHYQVVLNKNIAWLLSCCIAHIRCYQREFLIEIPHQLADTED